MRCLCVALSIVLLLSSSAFADEAAPADPKMTGAVSAVVWLPSGDADEFADESLGIRPVFMYRVHRIVKVVGSFDYIFVNEKSGTGAGDITYWGLSAGARVFMPRPGTFEPYGELLLGYYHLGADGVDDDSSIGFRFGGGVTYPFSGSLVATAGASYTSSSFDAGFFNIDVDGLGLDVGVGFGF